jgi:hypothetical protein
MIPRAMAFSHSMSSISPGFTGTYGPSCMVPSGPTGVYRPAKAHHWPAWPPQPFGTALILIIHRCKANLTYLLGSPKDTMMLCINPVSEVPSVVCIPGQSARQSSWGFGAVGTSRVVFAETMYVCVWAAYPSIHQVDPNPAATELAKAAIVAIESERHIKVMIGYGAARSRIGIATAI